MELKLKLVTTSPGGWVVGGWWVVDGWTKTKLMLFSTQVEVEVGAGLSLAKRIFIRNHQNHQNKDCSNLVPQNSGWGGGDRFPRIGGYLRGGTRVLWGAD